MSTEEILDASAHLTGIYPGTFDPITLGHMAIIKRAARLVDHLIISVASNPGKSPAFTVDERVAMIEEAIAPLHNIYHCQIEVRAFDNLLVHFAKDVGASIIIRGLRAVTDFEYEFQMTGMNAQVEPDVETVFLMSQDKYQFISSSFVKEIKKLQGDVSKFVAPHVLAHLNRKYDDV